MLFLVQKHQNKIIPKKPFMANLRLFAAVTSCKKSEQFHALTFDNTWKTLFWAHFGPLLAEYLVIRFFPKTNKQRNKQKISDCKFFIKFVKPHFWHILLLFGLETSKEDFSQRRILGNFKTLLYCNSNFTIITPYKKLEKFHKFNWQKTRKTSFWAILPRKPQNKIFPNKLGCITFSVRWHPNFMQKKSRNS